MSNKTLRNLVTPNYPTAPEIYSRQYQDQFTNAIRLFSNTVTNSINAPKIFGSFYDTTTQTNPVASAENRMKLDSTIIFNGVKIGSPTSRIFVNETGVYNIQFSAQFDKTGGGADTAYIWLKINGTSVKNSASKVVISGPNAETIAAWNFMVVLKAEDYFELAWSSPDTTMIILAQAAAFPVPEIPSVILTVNWVSDVVV